MPYFVRADVNANDFPVCIYLIGLCQNSAGNRCIEAETLFPFRASEAVLDGSIEVWNPDARQIIRLHR